MDTAVVRPGAAFEHAAFRWYQASRVLAFVGAQMLGIAVGWQIYALTSDPMHLGYVGLAQFVPAIGVTLIAGHVADRLERRRVILACQLGFAVCAALLCAIALSPTPRLWAIYAVLVAIGAARGFIGPAAQAMLPNLVPPHHFKNAVAWSSTCWHFSIVAGPALGGAMYAWAGRAAEVYGIAAASELVAAACVSMVSLPAVVRDARETTWQAMSAGLRFVWRRNVVLGVVSLDMFAVLLGGAVALLPIYARDILHVGPTGLGVLRSAPAAGATLMAVVLAYRPLERRAGATLLAAVLVFGLATIGFGLSRSLALSLAMLLVAGAADMVSVFVRHAVVQLATPDEMRGRVSAINLAFIGVSNELGEFESGVTAAWLGTVPAVVAGGAGTCLVVALWALLFPAMRRVDQLDAASLSR